LEDVHEYEVMSDIHNYLKLPKLHYFMSKVRANL